MAEYNVSVAYEEGGIPDTEVFEASSEVEAAFRAGFSLGVYYALDVPSFLQNFLSDEIIDAEGRTKHVTVSKNS